MRCKSIITILFHKADHLFITKIINKWLPFDIIIFTMLVLLGIVLQLAVNNSLPFFYILLIILIFCLLSSHFTSYLINNTYLKFKNSMIGDETLFVIRTKHSTYIKNKIIYIPIIFFGILVPIAAFSLMGINLNFYLKVYCFTGLSVVVMFCTYGAIQYILFIIFIQNIRKEIKNVTAYNKLNPQQTIWFKDLLCVSRTCNNLFLIVGFLFIVAFCVFVFSGDFKINICKISSSIFLVIFWLIIIVFIIFGAIILTLLSNFETKRILNGLYNNCQTTLKENYKYSKDVYTKNTFAILMSLLIINRNTKTLLKKNLLSYLFSIIDAIASVEATITLINIIIKTNIPSLIVKMI